MEHLGDKEDSGRMGRIVFIKGEDQFKDPVLKGRICGPHDHGVPDHDIVGKG